MELNNVRLLVKDFDNCFKFYSEKMGLKVTWGKLGGEYASFDIGIPSGLSIFKSDLMAAAIGNTDKELPINCREKVLLAIKVADVDKTYNELVQKEIIFITEPTDMTGWGNRTAHFADPEGNLIEIWSDLDFEKWDEDLKKDFKEFE